jgi:hypothetical protein
MLIIMKKKIYEHDHFPLTTKTFVMLIAIIASFQSCKKYLDAKPDQSIATPTTVDALEGILNNYFFINARYPSAGEVASDNYYLSTANFNSLIERQRMFYTWQKYDDIGGDYTGPYSAVEYANVILDALPNITGGDAQSKNEIQGNGLFLRASYHYALAQLFAKPYNKSTAATDLGIALRLTSDITVKPVRSSVADAYASILADLQRSVIFLPAQPLEKYRASKPAAYGMLARVYLSMSNYVNAGRYADSALNLYNKLIDYNSVSPGATIPFPQFNDEVIYDARTSQPAPLAQSRARVDTNLYNTYAANDLRKTLFFKTNANGMSFKGNYTGLNNGSLFTGMTTDELFLIKAEAQDRNGDINGALSTLNTLLSTRYQSGTYLPYTISDGNQLLSVILSERRKELVFRGLRWTDLRRLNQDSKYATTLYRNVNDTTFQLSPGSSRYVFEIDQNAVNISGLKQNP